MCECLYSIIVIVFVWIKIKGEKTQEAIASRPEEG